MATAKVVAHLTPVCFSVTSAFAEDDQQWPVGKTTQAPFHSLPSQQSQDEFVERLKEISASASRTTSNIRGHANIFTEFLGGDFTKALLKDSKQIADKSLSHHRRVLYC